MTLINRQQFMSELSKLLTFMFKEDRSEIIQQYNEMLDNAEDEQAMLESFGSPTRLAVAISRSYQRDERKLSVHADSKDGEDGEGEKIFEVVRLGALSKQKDGRQKFEIECSRRMEEE